MAKRLIDTNVILRYLLKDDPDLFARSSQCLEKVRTGEQEAIILESVLVECVYVLLKIYNVERETIAERLTGLLSYRGIANSDKKVLFQALVFFKQTRLSMVDCLLWARAVNEGLEIMTFEDALGRRVRKGSP
jgi:predicted nucleic-acid-binding protein